MTSGEIEAKNEIELPVFNRFINGGNNTDYRTGITIEFWIRFNSFEEDQVILENYLENGIGMGITVNEKNSVKLTLNDGRTENSWSSDPDSVISIQVHRNPEDEVFPEYAVTQSRISLNKIIRGKSILPLVEEGVHPHELGLWQNVRFETKGDDVAVYVDDQVVLQGSHVDFSGQGAIQLGAGLESGAIGKMDICFDNVRVTAF